MESTGLHTGSAFVTYYTHGLENRTQAGRVGARVAPLMRSFVIKGFRFK
jgi:hypothetical protein